MKCTRTDLGGGVTLFSCEKRSAAPLCSSCQGHPATRQCDAPVTRAGKPASCDRHLCDACAAEQPCPSTSGREGDTYDLCPAHARALAGMPDTPTEPPSTVAQEAAEPEDEPMPEAPPAEPGARQLVVRTARMGYRGPDWLDISLQGNRDRIAKGIRGIRGEERLGHQGIGMAFAPSAELLFPYLKRRAAGQEREDDWARYVFAYTDEMRVSYRRHRAAWDELLKRERVVLLCFCTDPERCHRVVFAEILGKLGAKVEHPVELQKVGYRCLTCGQRFEAYEKPRGERHGAYDTRTGTCGGRLVRIPSGDGQNALAKS